MSTVLKKSKPFEQARGKMHERPCDAEFVYSVNRSPTEQTSLHLGSIASALKVEEIPYEICLVATMNAEDSMVKRFCDDWQRHFAKLNIRNISYRGWDETNISWYYEWDRWVLKIVDFVMIWEDMVTQVNEHEVWYRKLHPDKLNLQRFGPLLWWSP